MRVLVLGGTVFLGRHLVDAALARGDQVTIFHRGRHPSHRAGEVEQLLGDRTTDLGSLERRQFDAVIDTCGYLPADVGASARSLRAAHYTFISSASVYADTMQVPLTESSAVLEPLEPAVTEVHGPLYGPQKSGCERALLAARPGSALILRAGLIGGPHDPTDRLTYWASRMLAPGPVLAPDVPDQPVQFIDVRDLAAWILRAAQSGVTGVMNANGPRALLTFEQFLGLCGDAEVHWVAEDELISAGVQPWSELPVWLPARFGCPGLMDMSTTTATAAGLATRPPAQTLHDTADWAQKDCAQRDPTRIEADYGTRARSVVLSRDREAALLARLPWR